MVMLNTTRCSKTGLHYILTYPIKRHVVETEKNCLIEMILLNTIVHKSFEEELKNYTEISSVLERMQSKFILTKTGLFCYQDLSQGSQLQL